MRNARSSVPQPKKLPFHTFADEFVHRVRARRLSQRIQMRPCSSAPDGRVRCTSSSSRSKTASPRRTTHRLRLCSCFFTQEPGGGIERLKINFALTMTEPFLPCHRHAAFTLRCDGNSVHLDMSRIEWKPPQCFDCFPSDLGSNRICFYAIFWCTLLL